MICSAPAQKQEYLHYLMLPTSQAEVVTMVILVRSCKSCGFLTTSGNSVIPAVDISITGCNVETGYCDDHGRLGAQLLLAFTRDSYYAKHGSSGLYMNGSSRSFLRTYTYIPGFRWLFTVLSVRHTLVRSC